MKRYAVDSILGTPDQPTAIRDGGALYAMVLFCESSHASSGTQKLMKPTAWLFVITSIEILLATFTGCGQSGPKLHPVKGTVMVEGKPADKALVFMHRKNRNALTDSLPFGTCNSDGVFSIETPSSGTGAEEGEYTITVFWPDMTKPEDRNGQQPDALNGAYDKVERSQIFSTVKAGVNELPAIKLSLGPKPRAETDKNIK